MGSLGAKEKLLIAVLACLTTALIIAGAAHLSDLDAHVAHHSPLFNHRTVFIMIIIADVLAAHTLMKTLKQRKTWPSWWPR